MSKISDKDIKKHLEAAQDECVRVCIRFRPMIHKKEKEDGRMCCDIDTKAGSIQITDPEDKSRTMPFTFDRVFGMSSTQQGVYAETAAPIVQSVVQGYNGTVIAYGQTGAGKTFTMEGNKEYPGLIPQCFAHIFEEVKKESKGKKFLVQVSMVQVYKEEVFDLLSKNTKTALKVRENPKTKNFYVDGLKKFMVNDAKQIEKVVAKGQKNRVAHATPMNPGSSRSHSIFSVRVETIETYEDGKEHVKAGKLSLVDLAGSERAKKTGGVRLQEMIKINWGLTCLGNVIMSLTDSKKAKHIPYRDSKLTKLLADSLGGNTKTVMIANCSPSSYNYDETKGTLRYAARTKRIQNKPIVNEDPKDALIRQFQEQIKKLREQLQGGAAGIKGAANGAAAAVITKGISIDKDLLEKMKKEEAANRKKYRMEMEKANAENQKKLRKEMEEKQKEAERKKKEVENKLKSKQEALIEEKKKQEALKKKLERMGKQLVAGGQLKAQNEKYKQTLEEKQKEIAEKRKKVEEYEQSLLEKEKEEKIMQQQIESKKKDIKIKTAKLKKLWTQTKTLQQENEEMVNMFQQEREEYLFAIKNLEKDLKLRKMIIDNFIPPDEVRKIESRAKWLEEEEDYHLQNAHLTGVNILRRKSALNYERPTSQFAMEQDDPRYKSRNVFNFQEQVKFLNEEGDVESSDEESEYESDEYED